MRSGRVRRAHSHRRICWLGWRAWRGLLTGSGICQAKMKTVQLCNNHLPGFLNKFTNSAARAHSPLVQYLPYLKDASAKATATGQRRQYGNPRGKHVRGETSPSTDPWMQVPTWSQQAESLASARLGLHGVKSCLPLISLEITAAFHSELAWIRWSSKNVCDPTGYPSQEQRRFSVRTSRRAWLF